MAMAGVYTFFPMQFCLLFVFFNDTATTEIYTLPYTTLFRVGVSLIATIGSMTVRRVPRHRRRLDEARCKSGKLLLHDGTMLLHPGANAAGALRGPAGVASGGLGRNRHFHRLPLPVVPLPHKAGPVLN